MRGISVIKNSDRFISSFNRIDHKIRSEGNYERRIPFSRVVEYACKHNAVVRRFKVDLLEFAELRNAIVHQSSPPEFVIAEPHSSIVEKIEEIERELLEPKLVIPEFRRKVECFTIYDSLAKVLASIKANQYSQFPIYGEGRFKGLLTTNGIANWLAHNIQEDIISICEATVADVLLCEENRKNYKFISRNTNIYEAEEIFKDGISKGKRLEALLITENGNPSEKLLGIVTTWDMVKEH